VAGGVRGDLGIRGGFLRTKGDFKVTPHVDNIFVPAIITAGG